MLAAVPVPCCAVRGHGPGVLPKWVCVRGAIPQSPVLPWLTPTSWFLPGIANVGCGLSGTFVGVWGVTRLLASYQHCGRAGWAWDQKPCWVTGLEEAPSQVMPPPSSLSLRGHWGVLPEYLQQ